MIFAKLWTPVPMAITACYAFLTLRAENNAIMDYMMNAVKFFVTSQQLFLWSQRDAGPESRSKKSKAES